MFGRCSRRSAKGQKGKPRNTCHARFSGFASGKDTRAADRIVGAHFFSPAHVMPLLEIVRTNDTSKQVRRATV